MTCLTCLFLEVLLDLFVDSVIEVVRVASSSLGTQYVGLSSLYGENVEFSCYERRDWNSMVTTDLLPRSQGFGQAACISE